MLGGGSSASRQAEPEEARDIATTSNEPPSSPSKPKRARIDRKAAIPRERKVRSEPAEEPTAIPYGLQSKPLRSQSNPFKYTRKGSIRVSAPNATARGLPIQRASLLESTSSRRRRGRTQSATAPSIDAAATQANEENRETISTSPSSSTRRASTLKVQPKWSDQFPPRGGPMTPAEASPTKASPPSSNSKVSSHIMELP